jgi:phosphatidylethanolamine/phosphatidyl-N-methylethanolamine N-methyltransferase
MPAHIEALYDRLAPCYDLVYGVGLEHGRRKAMRRLAPQPGEHVLEVGVGTGLSAVGYPAGCRVVAIDLSWGMLERAQARLVRHGCRGVHLCRMDAARLALRADHFDAVYAAYLINVVPDPAGVVRELMRVCRSGGRIVLLNHFAAEQPRHGVLDRALGWMATRAGGVNWRLDLDRVLRDTGLRPTLIEPVNLARVSSVVVCRKP